MTRSLLGPGALALAALAAGCILPQFPDSAGGCGAQVPLSYRVQAIAPFGTLEVRAVDRLGSPLASRSITAARSGYSVQCVAAVHGTTGSDGRVAFERLKIGDYIVWLEPPAGSVAASGSARVEENKTVSLTLMESTKP